MGFVLTAASGDFDVACKGDAAKLGCFTRKAHAIKINQSDTRRITILLDKK